MFWNVSRVVGIVAAHMLLSCLYTYVVVVFVYVVCLFGKRRAPSLTREKQARERKKQHQNRVWLERPTVFFLCRLESPLNLTFGHRQSCRRRRCTRERLSRSAAFVASARSTTQAVVFRAGFLAVGERRARVRRCCECARRVRGCC